jgi:hypothetical protein
MSADLAEAGEEATRRLRRWRREVVPFNATELIHSASTARAVAAPTTYAAARTIRTALLCSAPKNRRWRIV